MFAVAPFNLVKGIVVSLIVFLIYKKISPNCVKCGACADACPIGCISEGEDKYVIDADQCVDCGTCAAECPNDAISEE